MKKQISIIIRTYNEEKHLEELLRKLQSQITDKLIEVIIVDSGSIDNTLSIAKKNHVRIVHIPKEEFTFGRSLNIGCQNAKSDVLVFISGHCIPCHNLWLENLVKPLFSGQAHYVYGKQIGNLENKYSEHKIFKKYYPDKNKIPQLDFFCNNANSALRKDIWNKYLFDEKLTGLEDMELAKRIQNDKYSIAYIADAPVYHIHNETWKKIFLRYKREAIALQKIMPELKISFLDLTFFCITAIVNDIVEAIKENKLKQNLISIFAFRFMQYYGSYKGNHDHRKLSQKRKFQYFYSK